MQPKTAKQKRNKLLYMRMKWINIAHDYHMLCTQIYRSRSQYSLICTHIPWEKNNWKLCRVHNTQQTNACQILKQYIAEIFLVVCCYRIFLARILSFFLSLRISRNGKNPSNQHYSPLFSLIFPFVRLFVMCACVHTLFRTTNVRVVLLLV